MKILCSVPVPTKDLIENENGLKMVSIHQNVIEQQLRVARGHAPQILFSNALSYYSNMPLQKSSASQISIE